MMVHLLLAPCALVLLGAAAGCGNDNVNACRNYVDAANRALEDCGRDPIYDHEAECPASLGEGGPDCSSYYECLAGGWSCENGEVIVDVDECIC